MEAGQLIETEKGLALSEEGFDISNAILDLSQVESLMFHKGWEKDENGETVYEEVKDKNGNAKFTPIPCYLATETSGNDIEACS